MGERNLLHRSKLEEFRLYLGDRSLETKGEWEVVRWKDEKGNMCFVYDRNRGDHMTVSDYGVATVKNFIHQVKKLRECKNKAGSPPIGGRTTEIPDTDKRRLKELFLKETKSDDNYVDWEEYQDWLENKIINIVKLMKNFEVEIEDTFKKLNLSKEI